MPQDMLDTREQSGQICAFASVSLLTAYMIGLTFLEFYGLVSPTPRIFS